MMPIIEANPITTDIIQLIEDYKLQNKPAEIIADLEELLAKSKGNTHEPQPSKVNLST
jgi:hypothetical protein